VEIVPQTEERGVSVSGSELSYLRDVIIWIVFKNGLRPIALPAGVPETSMGSCPIGRDSGQRGRTTQVGVVLDLRSGFRRDPVA